MSANKLERMNLNKTLKKPTWLDSFWFSNKNKEHENKIFIGKTKSGTIQKLDPHETLKQKG